MTGPQRRHPRFVAEWLMYGLALVLTAGLLTAVLAADHRGLLRAESDRLQGQARVIDRNLSEQLDGADRALRRIAADIRTGTAVDPDRLTAQFKLLTEAMPGVSSMLWLNAEGTVMASARGGLLRQNLATRDYFTVPRRIADPERLYVSPPFQSVAGTSIVVASRMLVDDNGRFAGVVTATLSPDYFTVLLGSVLYAPDMQATLLHQDGAVFVDTAGADSASPTASSGMAERFAEHRRPGASPAASLDGATVGAVPRLVEFRELGEGALRHDKPLVAAVSRDLSAVLAPWRTRAWQASCVLVLFGFVSSGSLWLDQRRRREAFAASSEAERDRQGAADRVDQALRGADLGLWELHVPTHTFVTNAREREILGYAAHDELPQGPAWQSLIHPDDKALVDAAIVPHLKGKAPAYESEHRMLHRGGHYVWVFSRAMIVERGPKGVPVRIVGTHLDITERKRVEARQLLNERRLKAINDNVPAIVAHLDREQRYLTANEEFRRIFGIDPATMLGRTLREIRGEAVYAQMAEHLEAVLDGETRRFEVTDTVDGIRHHFQHSFVPDIDDSGTVRGFYSVSFDITDLRRSEELLVESSARHRSIVEEQSELVSLAREDGELIYVNRAHARHFGRPAAALVGENLFDLVLPADRAMARAVITEVFETGTARSGDSRVLSADGTERWVAWTNSLQRDAHGGVLLRSVGRDITRQRLAERALRASQRFLLQTGRVAGVGGWEVDLASGTLTWSEQVRRIHEVPDDFVPTLAGAIDFYAPEARPLIRAAVQRGIETGESWDLELRLVTATGRHVWVRAAGTAELAHGKATRLVGAFQDITPRKLAEQAVEQNERLLHAVTDNLPVFIMYIDRQETVLFLNVTAEAWLELPAGAAIGRPLSEALGPGPYAARRLQVRRALGGESQLFEVEVVGQGHVRHLEQHYIPDRQADGSVRGVFAMIHDITGRKAVERKLEELARVDALTGLPNRRQFDERLGQALLRSRRGDQHVAVMYLDIDHFKAINDSLGHAGGDTVLKEFGARLKASVRETDLAARLAGDEFVVLLEGLTIEDDAACVAQKIVDAMRVAFQIDGSSLRVTTSLGVGFSSHADTTAADLLACADKALYEAKRAGRDGFRLSNFDALAFAPTREALLS